MAQVFVHAGDAVGSPRDSGRANQRHTRTGRKLIITIGLFRENYDRKLELVLKNGKDSIMRDPDKKKRRPARKALNERRAFRDMKI